MTVLEEKVAIITGASSGIGEAAAKLFAREGARLVLGARGQGRLNEVVEEIQDAGGRAVALAGDVRDEDYACSLVQQAVQHFGGLDVSFNNAGVMGEVADVCSMTAGAWQETLGTNLTSAFFAAKHQIPVMLERGAGSVIFTSSFVGHTIGFAGLSAYAASKAGIIGMTKCLAVEQGQNGVRVNALLPGGTLTPMAGDFSADPSAQETIAGFHALKRMAEPVEIARAALFLASDASSFVTGSALLADGGNSITKA